MCSVNVPIFKGIRPKGTSTTSNLRHALRNQPRLCVSFAIPSSDVIELVLGPKGARAGANPLQLVQATRGERTFGALPDSEPAS